MATTTAEELKKHPSMLRRIFASVREYEIERVFKAVFELDEEQRRDLFKRIHGGGRNKLPGE